MPIGESDPETVRAERIEVADLAGRVLGLCRAAPEIGEMPHHGVPIALDAEFMRHEKVSEMDLAPLEGGLDPFAAGAKLDVADVGRVDRGHGERVPLRSGVTHTSLGERPKSSRT